MKRLLHQLGSVSLGWGLAVSSFGAETRIGEHRLSHPDGFEVFLAAGPPLIDRPIEMALDEQGRLYCTDSAGVNDKVEQQLEEKPHRVLRLEDTDGDGVYDERVVFADRMMFPEGCLWHDGSLYVAAPPSIWKLTDTDNDGVADVREEWFQGKTLTGCANDLHGPYLGLDGRIYWTKGAFAEQTYHKEDGSPWTTRAAHIFRSRVDGSGVEAVMTGGMDNPVGVTFTPGGERIFTTTFFQHPGGGKRDGLIHAIYGGVYGKEHGVIEGHTRTGALMPVLTHLGAAAPAGLTRYRSDVFGTTYRDNLFSALFNMQRVMRHRLRANGASFASTDEVFLESDNRNFHPTDVEEDFDGSLLVADTGGWYKLCCPTSQLPKPDVLGGIYRVRKIGAARSGSYQRLANSIESMSVHEKLRRLDDPRPRIGDQLIATLAMDGDALVEAVELQRLFLLSPRVQQRLVWALARVETPDARMQNRRFFESDDAVVRSAAIHSAGLHRDQASLPLLLKRLAADTVGNRRAAAEAIGRMKRSDSVEPLLKQLSATSDRVYRHSLIYALIEIGDPEPIALALESSNEREFLGALIAIDQMGGEGIRSEHVVRALAMPQSAGKWVARSVLAKRAELGSALVPVLRRWVADSTEASVSETELSNLLVALHSDPGVIQLIRDVLSDTNADEGALQLMLQVVRGVEGSEGAKLWGDDITRLVERRPKGLTLPATRTAAHIAQPTGAGLSVLKSLMRVSVDSGIGLEERLIALGVLGKHLNTLENEQFAALLEGVRMEHAVAVRSAAKHVLETASLSHQQLVQLARALEEVGPLEMGACLQAFEKADHPRVGLELVKGLNDSPGLPALTPSQVENALRGFPATVRESAESLIQRMNVNLKDQQTQISRLLAKLPAGDIRRGQKVFNSERAACSSCHEIGYLGGDVGPDLTRIGRVRSREDLLEAIVFPSLSFVRSYEPYSVVTQGGDQYSGVIRDDEPDRLTLVTGPGQSVTIPREDIFELDRSQVSLMPGGLSEILSETELADLLAFLEATRW